MKTTYFLFMLSLLITGSYIIHAWETPVEWSVPAKTTTPTTVVQKKTSPSSPKETQEVKRPSMAKAKIVIADIFGDFHEGLCAVKKGDKWGFIDTAGNQVIDFVLDFYNINYEYPFFSSGLCMLNYSNKGYKALRYIDKKGKDVINNPNYIDGTPFVDGYAMVNTKTRKFIYIDTKGIPIYPGISGNQETFVSIKQVRPFRDGLAAYYDFGKRLYGFIDRKGMIKILPQFTEAENFSEGLAAVQKKTSTNEMKWGFIDKTGKVVIDYIFSNKPGNVSDGMILVTSADNLKGYMNTGGQLVIDTKFADAFPFYQGMAFVLEWSKNYPIVIDKSGDKIRDLPVKEFGLIAPPDNGIMVYSEGYGYSCGSIKPDGTPVLKGYVNNVGIIYKMLKPFNSGLSHCIAPIDKKWIEGFINYSGDFVIVKGESKF